MSGGVAGAVLVRIAALRSRIGVLSRGGEYEIAAALLRQHAALGLGAGLAADSVRRAHQAAVLAEHGADPVASAESLLVLALGMIHVGDSAAAARAAEVATARAAQDPHLVACADLVLGVAERTRGRLAAARAALDRARARAAELARPDLTAAVLVELGVVDLADGQADAAAACFWFARDCYRLAGRPASAARAAALPLVGYASAARWADVAALAPAIIDDATAHGLADVAARVRGLTADAHLALGTDDAFALARIAADAALALPDGPVQHELALRARLRMVRLSADPVEQLRHLEAALDLGVAASDVPALAALAEALLVGIAEHRLPAGSAELLGELARALRRLAAFELADLTMAAQAELRVAAG